MRRIVLIISMIFSFTALAPNSVKAEALHVWFKAFIPNEHPTRPGYVRKIPRMEQWVIPGPTLPWTNTPIPTLFDTCFETDNRMFMPDPMASARITAEFEIHYTEKNVDIRKIHGREIFRSNETRELDCKTGALKASRKSDTSTSYVGSPASAGGLVQIILSTRASNPLAPRLGTPSIDFGGKLTWDVKKRELKFEGYTGVFPAFEAYASLDGAPPQRLFIEQVEDGTSTWHLYDIGLITNTKTFSVTLDLASGRVPGRRTTILPKKRLDDDIIVANARFQERTGGTHGSLLAAVGVSAFRAGLSEADSGARLAKAEAVLSQHKRELSEANLDLSIDETARIQGAMRALLRSGVLAGLPAEAEIRMLASGYEAAAGYPISVAAHRQTPGKVGYEDVEKFAIKNTHQALNLYRDAPINMREQYYKYIKPILKIDLMHSAAHVVAENYEFASQPNVSKILEIVSKYRDYDGNIELTEAVSREFSSLLPHAIKSIAPVVDAAAKRLKKSQWSSRDVGALALEHLSRSDSNELRAIAIAAKLSDEISVGNTVAALQLVTGFIARDNPRLARDVSRAGGALIQIAQAYSAYSSGVSSGGAITAGASAATGNYIGAALAIASMFEEKQESNQPDPAILTALTEIKEMLEIMRTEMHERFDRIDITLNKIFTETVKHFDSLRAMLDGVQQDVNAIQRSLVRIDRDIYALEMRMDAAFDKLRSDLVGLQMQPCLAWRESTVIYEMPPDEFVRCIARFAYLATIKSERMPLAWEAVSLEDLRIIVPERRPPSEILPYLAAIAAGKGYQLVPDVRLTELMAPEDWLAPAVGYLRVAHAWPEHYSGTPLRQLREIIERGRLVADALRNASNASRGAAFLDDLLQVHTSAMPELEAELVGTPLTIDTNTLHPGEVKSGRIGRCPLHFYKDKAGNFYEKVTTADEPGGARGWGTYDLVTENIFVGMPRDAIRIARLGGGEIRWCYTIENFEGQNPEPRVVSIELLGRLLRPHPTQKDFVSSRLLASRRVSTKNKLDAPWIDFVGGIAQFVPHGDPVEFAHKIWPELKATFESTALIVGLCRLSDPSSSACTVAQPIEKMIFSDEHLRRFAVGEADLDKISLAMLKQSKIASAELYRIIGSGLQKEKFENLEKASRVASAIAGLSLSPRTATNDYISAILYGAAPLLSAVSVEPMHKAGVPAHSLPEIGLQRAQAVRSLLGRAAEGGLDEPGSALVRVEEFLTELNAFLSAQVEKCKEGSRPVEACQ